MSVTGSGGVGIPIVLLYEGEGHTISVETKDGVVFYGLLREANDDMNLFMVNVKRTDVDGTCTRMEHLYIRGSMIRFIVFPEIISKSPMFKRVVEFKKTKGKATPKGLGARIQKEQLVFPPPQH